MSKTVMWAETDARGFETECLFNEDSRTYEVMVCANEPRFCRSESFPVNAEPVPHMDEGDRSRSIRIAERLIKQIAHELGDH
jgi:hypothetical protein